MFIVAGIVVNQKYGVSHMSNGALRGSLGLGPNCAVNITSCPGRPGCGAGAQCVSTLIGCQCQNLCREVGQSCCTAGSTFCCPGLFWDGASNTCMAVGACAAPDTCTTGIGAGPNQCPAGSTFGPANGCGIGGVYQGTNGCCTTPPPPPPPPVPTCASPAFCSVSQALCTGGSGVWGGANGCAVLGISLSTNGCCTAPQCSNGIDDDGDTLIDNGIDPGCSAATDNDETNAPAPTCAAGSTCKVGIGTGTSQCPPPSGFVPNGCEIGGVSVPTNGCCTPPPPPVCTAPASCTTNAPTSCPAPSVFMQNGCAIGGVVTATNGCCTPPPACKNKGQSCSSPAECCGPTCTGSFGNLTCGCAMGGATCSQNTDCCTLNCNAGTCGASSAPSCISDSFTCDGTIPCCSSSRQCLWQGGSRRCISNTGCITGTNACGSVANSICCDGDKQCQPNLATPPPANRCQ